MRISFVVNVPCVGCGDTLVDWPNGRAVLNEARGAGLCPACVEDARAVGRFYDRVGGEETADQHVTVTRSTGAGA